jgi:hypothetical protein
MVSYYSLSFELIRTARLSLFTLSGLPAIFNKYEIQLLTNLDIVQLIHKPGLLKTPDLTATAEFEAMRQQQIAEQNEEYRKHQIESTRQMFQNNQCGIKKKKSKNKKRAALQLEPGNLKRAYGHDARSNLKVFLQIMTRFLRLRSIKFKTIKFKIR